MLLIEDPLALLVIEDYFYIRAADIEPNKYPIHLRKTSQVKPAGLGAFFTLPFPFSRLHALNSLSIGIIDAYDPAVVKSARNIKCLVLTTSDQVAPYDVLASDECVMTRKGYSRLLERLKAAV